MINNALRGKQNLNYKIYWEKKLMNRIDYSSSVMNSPQNFTSLLSKLKTLFNILINFSEIYQPQAIKHNFLN